MARAGSTFEGTENPLSESGAWTVGPGSFSDLQKNSGEVRVVTTSSDAGAAYTGTSFGSNQFSRVWVTVVAGGGGQAGALTRIQSGSGACYALYGNTSVAGQLDLYKVTDNGSALTFTLLGAAFASLVDSQGNTVSLVVGDCLELQSNGSTHEVFLNSVSQGTRSDATHTGGQPGIAGFALSSSTDILSAWEGGDIEAAPTFFDSASNPADNGTQTGATPAVTPPGSMLAGDLVLLIARTRDSAGVTMAMSQQSGQSWNPLAAVACSNETAQPFWCRFNGTWGADPSIAITNGTSPYSIEMLVVRPGNASSVWGVDVALVELDFSAGTGPLTIVGLTTIRPRTVTIAGWFTPNANTYSTLVQGSSGGQGWIQAGVRQYRNTSGSDHSASYAYKVRLTAGATGNVAKNQSASIVSTSFIVTFYEQDNFTKSISESVSAPTDAVTRVFTGHRAIAESVAKPTDAVTRVFTGHRAIAESVAKPTDAVSRIVTPGGTSYPRTIAESVPAPTDAVARAFTGHRAIAEAVAKPTDAVARALALARAIAESVAKPTDAVTRALGARRAVSESVSAPTDAVSRLLALARAISESVPAPADAVSRVVIPHVGVDYFRTITEVLPGAGGGAGGDFPFWYPFASLP